MGQRQGAIKNYDELRILDLNLGSKFLLMICRTCSFETDRMLVREWNSLPPGHSRDQNLASLVVAILTPPVTRSLPEEWQGEYTLDRATKWIDERNQNGATLLVLERSSKMTIGLMLLFESDDDQSGRSVRIGYLLAESVWGRGLASELLKGFVDWCRTVEITSIVGGVERNNIASQRVLEKNGFTVLSNGEDRGDFVYGLQV